LVFVQHAFPVRRDVEAPPDLSLGNRFHRPVAAASQRERSLELQRVLHDAACSVDVGGPGLGLRQQLYRRHRAAQRQRALVGIGAGLRTNAPKQSGGDSITVHRASHGFRDIAEIVLPAISIAASGRVAYLLRLDIREVAGHRGLVINSNLKEGI
jgi:hypothetical protein